MNFSVLISVYIKEKPEYFYACLQSIAEQTKKASEIIIVADGPLTKELYEVIDKFEDQLPIKKIQIEKNLGLAKALNFGLSHCSHSLVARMDSDDICTKDRFEEQVKYLQENPKISVLSSWIEERDEKMEEIFHIKKLPSSHQEILVFSKTRSPIAHPVVIYRKDDVLKAGGYPEIYPEDYALWNKMLSMGFNFANVQKVLLVMRTGDSMLQRRGFKFLKGEIQVHFQQYRLGLISGSRLLMNIIIKMVLRLAPLKIKNFLYKNFR